MERNKRIDKFAKYINEFHDSQRRVEEVLREEETKQNIITGKMIQLYKSEHKRKKLLSEGKKFCFSEEDLIKLNKISEKPFNINNLTVLELEKWYELDLYVQGIKEDKNNRLSRIGDNITDSLFGKIDEDNDNMGGD